MSAINSQFKTIDGFEFIWNLRRCCWLCARSKVNLLLRDEIVIRMCGLATHDSNGWVRFMESKMYSSWSLKELIYIRKEKIHNTAWFIISFSFGDSPAMPISITYLNLLSFSSRACAHKVNSADTHAHSGIGVAEECECAALKPNAKN